MNQEPKHLNSGKQPDRRQVGDEYIEHVVDCAADQDAVTRIRDTYARHGTAFAIYLALEDIDQQSVTVEQDFLHTYTGFYWDTRTLICDTIENFDWGIELDRALTGDPMLRAMVKFDHDAIWAFVAGHYEIVDLDGGLYVYEPQP